MKISLEWISEFVDISDKEPGLLADDLTMIGLEIEGIEEVDGDTILEISVTPNRPDCLSHVGVAREIAALYARDLVFPDTGVAESGSPVEAMTSIEVEDPEGCPRYSGRVLEGVTIGPSPEKVSRRLESLGVRSINNVVDATNYVLMELGQPLHAFDYHRLAENRIVIRKALSGEVLVTLDGQERKLDPEDLLICDGLGSIALAGIMGGENSEVQEDTTDLLLESACFDPVTIRKTSKKLGLSTEASYRFERGTDPEGTLLAVNRLARLINKWAGGSVCAGAVDVHPRVEGERTVPFRMGRIRDLLGVEISDDNVVSILNRLALEPGKGKKNEWSVTVPGFRRDIDREEDVIEEVARHFGYQRIPVTMPAGKTVPVAINYREKLLGQTRSILEGMGYSEAITYSFIDKAHLSDLGLTGGPDPVKLMNPLSEEMEVMRTSLLPGLLSTVQFNANRRMEDVRLYEIGSVFIPCTSCEISLERARICGVMTGLRGTKTWYRGMEESDFFDIKGAVEGLLEGLGIRDVSFQEVEMPYLQPGQSGWVMVGERSAGPLGTLHPKIREKYGIKGWAGCFELELDVLEEETRAVRSYTSIPRYPEVLRDLALLVPPGVSSRDIETAIRESGKNLSAIQLFDLYDGKGIPEGHRSLAYSLAFRSNERTLTDEEVDVDLSNIVKTLKTKLGVKVR